MSVGERLLELAHTDERAVLFTVVEGPQPGAKLLVPLDGGEPVGDAPASLAALAPDLRRNGMLQHDGMRVFAELFGPPPRLVVVGAVDTAESLCAGAKILGWRTICVDARAAFATEARIPSADELLVEWPDVALARIAPDHRTAVVVLTHDLKFDVPALQAALGTDAFYVAAIGGRNTQEKRRDALLQAGIDEADVERVHAPAGLDIGADSPAETAVAILSEALAARSGRDGTSLKTSAHRIHVEVEA